MQCPEKIMKIIVLIPGEKTFLVFHNVLKPFQILVLELGIF